MDKVQVALDKFSRNLEKYPQLQELENKFGVPKLYIVGGGAGVLLLVLFFGFGAGMLCNLVGFIYPAYMSFKAIESEGSDDDTQWLTYWVVYACFNMLEVFVDTILFWVPFYFAFKFGFLVWCFLPNTQGAAFLYHHFLAPFLRKHESRIDSTLEHARENSGGFVSELSQAATDLGSKAVAKGVEYKMNQQQ
eukprot:CAMPEP_0182463498 /NCGR_PEP_ID=MMETSP1319-20130603/7392_1 /TAXON_ID=172717 /ORGANISM="Bolidomonas pacifica, Strain RCC208" /LENGTH=191 /DNA_ID=CAMNT_0024663043 /DNA_START=66 /DNA_END=641 /DNA_ORIENTATION=-